MTTAMDINPEAELNAAILGWLQELAPQGLLITDQELRIRSWNHWLEIHGGIKAGEAIGRTIFEVFPEVDVARTENIFKRALKGEVQVVSSALHGCLFPFPSTVRESHFERMQQTARIAPLKAQDELVGTITILEDVTQRDWQTFLMRQQQERDQFLSWALARLLKTEEPEGLLRELFSRLHRLVNAEAYLNYMVEPDGKNVRLHAAEGWTPEQERMLLELEIGEALCGLAAETHQPLIFPRVQESHEPRAEGAKRLGLRAYVAHPLVLGEQLLGVLAFGKFRQENFAPEEVEFLSTVAQYLSIALDRTRREKALRQAQNELRAHAEQLEREVAERTESLRESLKEMESFTYSVAHDLRAPIRFLAGYARALLEDHGEELSAQASSYVNNIQRSAEKMDALTRDLLRYSHVSQEKLRLLAVNVVEIVTELMHGDPILSQDKVLVFEGENFPVIASPVLLRQCLQNLLENAVKFVPPDREPRIVLRLERRPGDILSPGRVRIWVEDNGIGIAPEFQQKVFGIFERVCDPHEYQGTGIGLAIVAKAMQRMGGSYGVESEPGKGSRFWLEFESSEF